MKKIVTGVVQELIGAAYHPDTLTYNTMRTTGMTHEVGDFYNLPSDAEESQTHVSDDYINALYFTMRKVKNGKHTAHCAILEWTHISHM